MKLTLPIIIIFSFISLLSFQSVHASKCGSIQVPGIIYQPWLDDIEKPDDKWNLIFQNMQSSGIKTILIQWTAYGDVDFIEQHERALGKQPTLIQKLLGFAEQYDMKIIFGLWSDPNWFQILDDDDQAFELYLRKLRATSLAQAEKLLTIISNRQLIAGWYLPEEIDDKNWRSVSRKNLLKQHLSLMVKELSKLAIPTPPVMISTFFTGKMLPEDYATMIEGQAESSGVTFLVQDGTGINRLTDYQTALYLNRLQSKNNWHGILENFTPLGNNQGFGAASPQVIKARKELWCSASSTAPQFIFSLRYLSHVNYLIRFDDN